MKRPILAFLVAPLWVPVLAVLYFRLSWHPDRVFSQADRPSFLLIGTGLGLAAGYTAMALFGLPAHHLLERRGYRSALAYVCCFTGIGFLFWGVALIASGLGGIWSLDFALRELIDTLISRPYIPLSAGLLGGLVGGTFRLLGGVRSSADEPSRS